MDAETFDLNEKVCEEARIKLPESTRRKVFALDKLFSESLNWQDPDEPKWNKSRWDNFHSQTRALHKEISNKLGEDFEIIYKQE